MTSSSVFRRLTEQRGRLKSYEVRSFFMSLGPTAGTLMLQLVTFVILGRGLGASAFGQYAALTAITAVLVEVIGCGGGDILVRGIILRPTQFSLYFGSALLLLGITLPIAGTAGIFIAWLLIHVQAALLPMSLFIFGELIAGRLLANAEMMSNAKRHILGANAVRLTLIGSRFLLAIGVFATRPHTDVSAWLMECAVQSAVISVLVYIYLVRRYGAPEWRLVSKTELGTGMLFSVAQTARTSQGNVDRAFLAAFSMGAIVGSYAAASRITQLGLFPIQIVNRILYPRFFAHGAEGVASGRRFAIKCAPLLAGIGALSGCSVAAVGYFIPELLGHGFLAARPFALALSTAVPLMALQYPAADALTGSGKQALRTIIYVITACSFGVLLVVGAAVAGPAGLTAAFILGQAGIAALLWTMLFLQKDDPVGRS